MGKNSAIEWCDHTFNPWWGCVKVSPGCQHCYADTLATRYGYTVWGPATTTSRRFFGATHWQEPLRWNRDAARDGVRRRVFCASMADVFEENADLVSERQKLWALIEATPWLDWLLLTKRPEHINVMLPQQWLDHPRPNVWLGTSVETQDQAARRIPLLQGVRAAVLFLSCEPLLGPLDLDGLAYEAAGPARSGYNPLVDWIIVGGESGHGARPMHPDWVRSLRDQCTTAGIAFHFKQWGEYEPCEEAVVMPASRRVGKKRAGRLLDNRTWDQFPEVHLSTTILHVDSAPPMRAVAETYADPEAA